MPRRFRTFEVIDTSNSTAVEFLAWCAAREELYAIYRGSTKLIVYVKVRGDAIEEIASSGSLGGSLARLRQSGLHYASPQEYVDGCNFLRRASGQHSWLRFPEDNVGSGQRDSDTEFDAELWTDDEEPWFEDDEDREEPEDPYLEAWDIAEIVEERTIYRASVEDVFNRDPVRPQSLPFADFRAAILDGCTLESANLEGTLFDRASLVRSNLSRAFLFSASLRDAVLDFANLEAAYLVGAQLQGARLIGANLRYANLVSTNLEAADLCDADLRGATISEESLAQATTTRARLPNSM